jgi:hypothetical protein
MKTFPVSIFFTAALAGCMGYVPGQQSYWDAQVREMCAKDGGVHIIERVRITENEMGFLSKDAGKLIILAKELAHPKSPVYAVREKGKIFASEGNSSIGRTEWSVIRRSDQKVVANLIRYSRTGGDFPEFVHQSTFFCPSAEKITNDLQKIFLIEGDSK